MVAVVVQGEVGGAPSPLLGQFQANELFDEQPPILAASHGRCLGCGETGQLSAQRRRSVQSLGFPGRRS